jgi:hypothetical protein
VPPKLRLTQCDRHFGRCSTLFMASYESPFGRGGAQRRGGVFVAATHPEAFGFCPSQEGIDSLGMLSDNRSLMGFRDKATIEMQNSGRSHFVLRTSKPPDASTPKHLGFLPESL